jgi:hypothetical protein
MNFNKTSHVHLKIVKTKISSSINNAVNVYLKTFSKSLIHVQFLMCTSKTAYPISSEIKKDFAKSVLKDVSNAKIEIIA